MLLAYDTFFVSLKPMKQHIINLTRVLATLLAVTLSANAQSTPGWAWANRLGATYAYSATS
jgi:hypothetical protein